VFAEKRRGAFTEALKVNTPSPTKPTPAKKPKADVESYQLFGLGVVLPEACGNSITEGEPGKSDRRSAPVVLVSGSIDDQVVSPTSSRVSASGWEEHPQADSPKRRAEGKGKGARSLDFGKVIIEAAVSSSSGTAARDIADVGSSSGVTGRPSPSRTEYYRIDSENLDREAELLRVIARKEEDAVRSRGELEEPRRLLESLAAEKDKEISLLRNAIAIQRSMQTDLSSESEAYLRR